VAHSKGTNIVEYAIVGGVQGRRICQGPESMDYLGCWAALQGPLSVADSGPGWVPHHKTRSVVLSWSVKGKTFWKRRRAATSTGLLAFGQSLRTPGCCEKAGMAAIYQGG
jgi:hypothetical protein